MQTELRASGSPKMPMRPSLPWLLTTLAAALIAMTVAASAARKVESALAAAVFAVMLVATAVRTNSPLWRRSTPTVGIAPRDAIRQTAQLIMLAYLWCAIAFLAIYLGAGVRWQHGWQYGTALLLIALAHVIYLRRLADPSDSFSAPPALERAVRLSSYQAVLIAVGLIWLIRSGKLSSLKGDWAANQLFLAGGFAVMCLSVIMIKTYAVLSERQAAKSEAVSVGSADSKSSPGPR
jgi:hypothetical protein